MSEPSGRATTPRGDKTAARRPAVRGQPARPPALDVLAWVATRDGRLLTARSHGSDAFYAPGGKREPGESDAAALRREIAEELGIELDPATLTLVTVITAPAHGGPPGQLVRMICYAADPAPDAPEPAPHGEIAELRWLAPAERDLAAPADQALIDHLLSCGDLPGPSRATGPEPAAIAGVHTLG